MKSIPILAALGGTLLVMGALGTAAFADDENTNVQAASNNAASDQASAAISGDAAAFGDASTADSGDALSFNLSVQDQSIAQDAPNQSDSVENGGEEMVPDNDENTNVQIGQNGAWSDQASAAIAGDALAAFGGSANSGDALSFNLSFLDQEIDQDAANQSDSSEMTPAAPPAPVAPPAAVTPPAPPTPPATTGLPGQ
jgi:hypothetical protein